MTTRPTRSTLFPYTTLFRSKHPQLRWPKDPGQITRIRDERVFNASRKRQRLKRYYRLARLLRHEGQKAGHSREQDRKSTRLNSSHSQISYAVFCLKKKKNR